MSEETRSMTTQGDGYTRREIPLASRAERIQHADYLYIREDLVAAALNAIEGEARTAFCHANCPICQRRFTTFRAAIAEQRRQLGIEREA